MRVIHVVPDEWGPFVDIRTCLSSLTERNETVRTLKSIDLNAVWPGCDPDDLLVLWSLQDPGPIDRRDCYIAAVYSEALDEDESKLLPEHLAHWQRFQKTAPSFDAIFVHTPWMCDLVAKKTGRPTFVMPVGWDAAAMGVPRWDTPKHNLIGYRGSSIGRRAMIIPALGVQFGANEFVPMTGQFGRALLGNLDTTAIDLYVAHSPVRSFSTWRLWQAASTSTTLVAEVAREHLADSWPFIEDEHFIGLTPIEPTNIRAKAIELLALAKEAMRTTSVSRAAHALARQYTVDRIHRDFVLPAFEMMRDQ
jgi:hypothetical protein